MKYLISLLSSVIILIGQDLYNYNVNSDCFINQQSNVISKEKQLNLINQRKIIKNNILTNTYSNNRNILYIPVVFHNIYKIVENDPVASYCDYNGGFSTTNFQYTTDNNQEICNARMLRSLEVLNANYSSANIEFILHPDFPEMLHRTDPGYDGFYERATGGTDTSPSAYDLKEYYNIPNALNIYIIDFVNTREGTLGIATYPWSYGILGGIFIKHGQSPGDSDAQYQADYIRTLMHEIGHYFSLLHINGIWYVMEGNTPRELVNGTDCNENGDLICDTPAEAGMTNNAWYTDFNLRECVYHGYSGEFNLENSILKIGGYNHTYFSGYYPYYNYCNTWNIEDPYGLDNCQLFTNYDNTGDFFGTKELPDFCFNEDSSDHSTECDIINFDNLPIGYNFMRAGSFPYDHCGTSPINDNIYYNEFNRGFTAEQIENIRYSVENDYSGCIFENSDNYSEYFLISKINECMFSGYYSGDINQDQETNIVDIVLLVQFILDQTEFLALQEQLSNINQDESINIVDIVLLVDIVLQYE